MAATPIYGKNIKKSSCQKPLVRFQNNFTFLFLESQYSKFIQESLIHQKTWPPDGAELNAYVT